MKHKQLKLCALFLLGVGLTSLQAQEAIPASGSVAIGSGGSASYSVGQVAYTTNTGENCSIAQGVQQPYEISVIWESNPNDGMSLTCTAYPNPTADLLTLKVENYSNEDLMYRLFDLNGKLWEYNKVTGPETIIKMRLLAPSVYILRVTNKGKNVKTFKIVKY